MKEKKCKGCNLLLKVSNFYILQKKYLSTYCKTCHNNITHTNRREKNYLPRNPMLSTIISRHYGIRQRCRESKFYKNIECLISREDFIKHFFNDEFKSLYKLWEEGGKKRGLTPSIDRINSKDHYRFGNLRWITASENSRLGQLNRYKNKAKEDI